MRLAPLLAALLIPSGLFASSELCPGGQITVVDGGDHTQRICTASEAAIRDIEACNLTLDQPLTIQVSPDLGDGCVGLYHCGKGLIEVLPPAILAEMKGEMSLFAPLDVMTYFDSILYHELVHAAFDNVPCPFEGCPATSEYLAYSMQLRSLSDEDRAAIGLGRVPSETVSRDAINAILVFWAPDRFAVRAWTHLMQRPDPCGYVGLIAEGAIRFDHEAPFVMAPPN